MNEARKNKQNAWKHGVVALGLSTALLTGGMIYQSNEVKQTVKTLETTTKSLNETKAKVEVQDKQVQKILEENKSLTELKDDNNETITDLVGKLRDAATYQQKQAQKIQQLEADLKKKRASRITSSATSHATPVSSSTAGMMTFHATAYSYQDPNSAGGGVITASGTHVTEGRTIAVDKSIIPLGSSVQITCPDYPAVNGTYIAEDTGGAIHGNIIDIYIQSESKALDFGRRTIYVKVLN